MPKIVQLSAYGGVDQLKIVDVAKPAPQAGEVVVHVIAAGHEPGRDFDSRRSAQGYVPDELSFWARRRFCGAHRLGRRGRHGLCAGRRCAWLVRTTLGASRVRCDQRVATHPQAAGARLVPRRQSLRRCVDRGSGRARGRIKAGRRRRDQRRGRRRRVARGPARATCRRSRHRHRKQRQRAVPAIPSASNMSRTATVSRSA